MIKPQDIQSILKKGKVIYLDKVDSTNNYVKANPINNGDVVITTNQTAGKGRLGRTWDSNGGIAMTLCIVPGGVIDNIPVVSLIFATAVCMTLRETFNLDFLIKWPNDIVVNGKKLCGILTEAVTEHNTITKIACGIGINITNECFDNELSNKATSLKLEGINECNVDKLVADIVNTFYSYDFKLPESFKQMCVTLGKSITVISVNGQYDGVAVDITNNGELIVKANDGSCCTVNSGEVSVRGIYGYA